MRTVRDFKSFVLREAGVSDHHEFGRLSRGHEELWRTLNDLGWEKKTKPPEETEDIDAVAPLTDNEWADLQTKFRQLC
jgi:hypothetical protein